MSNKSVFIRVVRKYFSNTKGVVDYFFKWLFFSVLIGMLSGSASALLLWSLEWAEDFRDSNLNIIWFLPIAGLVIGFLYYYFGQSVVKGNNQILQEYHEPKRIIPFKMAPFVLLGTILTHLFGGSAGREGTAVQMGSAISDQFSRWFDINSNDRRILLILGISGGFASVFGTPIAGSIFALEVLIIGRMKYDAILPVILTAVFANITCNMWGIHHTLYSIPSIPNVDLTNLFLTIICGIAFGLVARLFSGSTHFFQNVFKTYISYPPLRPFVGGLIIALAVYWIGSSRFIGLGVPVIQESFIQEIYSLDFLIKLIFTAFTLGAGFKGGEVTPLFFIGAALGNALVFFIPLPIALLAGMGFVAVFSGATNTPIACVFMGIELFGSEGLIYFIVACFVSYLVSGKSGIYSSQKIVSQKIA